MSQNIVVVGSCMIDLTSYTTRLPKPGETLIGTSFTKKYGGKGANQCVAAAKLGESTALVASLGSDVFGHEYLDVLKQQSIDLTQLHLKQNSHTGIAQITVTETGENSIIIIPGANMLLDTKDVNAATDLIKNARVLVCQFEIPLETTLHTLKLRQGRKWSIVNGSPAVENIDPEIFRLCDVFCVNEVEVELITGIQPLTISKAQEAVDEFINRGCNIVIITLGSQGAVWASREERTVTSVPTSTVKPVDTCGAGDAFLGAFAYFLANNDRNNSMNEIIKRSCFIASQSVLKQGTQSSFPNRSDLPQEWFQ